MNPDLNWCRVLAHHASRNPDKNLAVFNGTAITYQQMAGRTAAAAAGLKARGIGAGDVVALLSYNNIDFLTTIFAANYLGATVMPLNWRLAAAELDYILDHSEARAIVCDAACSALATAASTTKPELVRICIGEVQVDGWERFADLITDTPPPPRAETQADDIHRLMYTSGTTGRPKGVMLTYSNLAWKNYAHITEFAYSGAEVGLACGPLYHVGALDLTTTSLIAVGATTIIHESFKAEKVVEEIERSGVTTIWLAPAMVRGILDLPGIEDRDLSTVRLIIGGGEKMPIPTIERLHKVFPGAWFADAYGLTETVSGDTFLDNDSIRTKLGSVGRPCLYLELEIWDEAGIPVAAGTPGEVVLRGPKVFKGYWRNPEATAAAFEGGWFHTGDIGVKDADGYLFIVDRLKDMIVSGGENIASSEVERVLYDHPDVVEVAVVGRADERWGEVPVAFVVTSASSATTAEELIAHCTGQLAKFKVPKAVLFIDALPRNPSGKVLKRELRDQL
jgi:fatty-acyl-CoA synthase